MKPPTISIVVSAFDEEGYIGECLACILRNTGPEVTEILVIDNASSDKTAQIAQSYPRVRVIREDQKGVSFARQRGYSESRGDIIVFLYADTHIPQKWTQKVLVLFMKNERVSFVTGPCFYYDLRWYENIVCFLFGPLFYIGSFFVGPIGVGGNMALRRTALKKIGGFDTTIIFYGDDTDIARRSSQVGKAVFSLRLVMPTSGRRLHGLGVTKTHIIYLVNYLSVSLFGKPYHSTNKKFR